MIKLLNNETKGECIVTSAPAFIPKIYKKYRWHIIIRGEKPEEVLAKTIQKINEKSKKDLFTGWVVDRDPVFLS
jgi:primosomal protein N'